MPMVESGYWVLAVVGLAVCGVISLAIAAWLVRELARAALEKSAQEDVPKVLVALSGILEKLSLLLPWSRNAHQFPRTAVPQETINEHTRSLEDLSEGGSQ